MKLSKIFLSYSPLLILLTFILISSQQIKINNPNSSYNDQINQINRALSLSTLKFSVTDIAIKRKEVELQSGNTTAFFSLDLNPLTQVTDLQNIIKTANIKGKYVELIDLTSKNSYATLKNR